MTFVQEIRYEGVVVAKVFAEHWALTADLDPSAEVEVRGMCQVAVDICLGRRSGPYDDATALAIVRAKQAATPGRIDTNGHHRRGRGARGTLRAGRRGW